MRTTIVLDNSLFKRVKSKVSGRQISAFVNQCIRGYFDRIDQENRLKELEKAYARAAGDPADDFDVTEVEDWPE